jgi:hypothetical protein
MKIPPSAPEIDAIEEWIDMKDSRAKSQELRVLAGWQECVELATGTRCRDRV